MSGNIKEHTQQAQPVFRPATDMAVSRESYLLRLALPGVAQEDLELSIKGNLLSLMARGSQKSPDGKPLRQEFRLGDFQTSFAVPEDVDAEQIKADLRDGVLTLSLFKRKEAMPRKIQIQAT